MNKPTATLLLSVGLGSISFALAQTTPSGEASPSATPTASASPAASPSAGGASPSPQASPIAEVSPLQQVLNAKTLNFLHHTNQLEITESQQAQPKIQTQSVNALAQMIISDHQTNETSVQALAGQLGVTLAPFQQSTYETATSDALQQLSGTQFERAYVLEQIAGHQAVLNELNLLQQSVEDTQVQGLIADTIPVIQSHLQQAQTVLGQLPAAGATPTASASPTASATPAASASPTSID